jgi:hypothetical protein
LISIKCFIFWTRRAASSGLQLSVKLLLKIELKIKSGVVAVRMLSKMVLSCSKCKNCILLQEAMSSRSLEGTQDSMCKQGAADVGKLVLIPRK